MVNIDAVYQRVLALANKEQRGYITPQEFNLFANQAQMEILDQYFYDLNQTVTNVEPNSTQYSDMTTFIDEKLSVFKKTGTSSIGVGGGVIPPGNDLYRWGGIYKVREWSQYIIFAARVDWVGSPENICAHAIARVVGFFGKCSPKLVDCFVLFRNRREMGTRSFCLQ